MLSDKAEVYRDDQNIEGMKRWLAQVARDTDERALWGVRMAAALGILEWYGEALSEARGWND